MASTASKTPLVKFFGLGKATPEFIQRNGIYYSRENGNVALFAQRNTDNEVRVYLLFYGEALLVVEEAAVPTYFGIADCSAAALSKIKLARFDRIDNVPPTTVVLDFQYDDGQIEQGNFNNLAHLAHDAALKLGATNATGNWLMRLIEPAFTGFSPDYNLEYTATGLLLSLTSKFSSFDTTKRQLKKLQALDILSFTPVRGQEAVILRFRRDHLAGLNQAAMPQFFNSLLY